jgi:MFS family permease
MSTFYPKFSLGFRMGMFSGMYAVAGAFAGLLAYGLLHLETSSLRGWQMLFLVEGVITVGVAFIAAAIMPTEISKAWFLTEVERAHALRRMERDSQTTSDSGIGEGVDSDGNLYSAKDDQKITMRDIKDVVMDWKKLLIILFNILSVLVRFDLVPFFLWVTNKFLQPVTAFTTFLPLVVQGMGYSGIQATLMSVPPFVVGTAGLLAIVYSSDHFKERSLHTCFGMALGLIGCLVMATSSNPRLRYGFAHVCLSGVFAGGPLIAVWLAGNTPQKVRTQPDRWNRPSTDTIIGTEGNNSWSQWLVQPCWCDRWTAIQALLRTLVSLPPDRNDDLDCCRHRRILRRARTLYVGKPA